MELLLVVWIPQGKSIGRRAIILQPVSFSTHFSIEMVTYNVMYYLCQQLENAIYAQNCLIQI